MDQIATSNPSTDQEDLCLRLEAEPLLATETIEVADNQQTTECAASSCDPIVFEHFSELPAELRLQIWSYSIQPAFIEVHILDIQDHLSTRSEVDPLPAISKVCKESRDVFLEEYYLLVATEENEPGLGPVYINPRIDTVYFGFDYVRSGRQIHHYLPAFMRNMKVRMQERLEASPELQRLTGGERAKRLVEMTKKEQRRCGIRNLALGAEFILRLGVTFNENYARMRIFDDFPFLEDLLFVIDFRASRCEHCRDVEHEMEIIIPETECEMKFWRFLICGIGWLKAIDHPNHPGHNHQSLPWMRATVSIGVRRKEWDHTSDSRVIDSRQGLGLFGPFNIEEQWIDAFKTIGIEKPLEESLEES